MQDDGLSGNVTVAGTDVVNIETIAPYVTGPATLVTARSYLIDRYVPECEIIALPPKEVAGGQLTFGRDALPLPPDPRGRLARLRGARPSRTVPDPDVIDLRRNYPQNWAHFLNNHLPLLFHIAEEMGMAPDRFLLLLPVQTPSYIRAAAAFFGLRTLETDDILQGQGVVYEVAPWTANRPVRAAWVRQSGFTQERLVTLDVAMGDSPRRVFLSRRGTRNIENEPEVAAWLAARGFVTIYPEDLDVADQLRLFRKAEIMVATSGAGLAPLLYAQPGGKLRQIVEITPVGLMTDVYRVMADQVGCNWIGVRGQIKSSYIPRAYDLRSPMVEFSFDSFTVDLVALERAFALAGIEQ